MQDLVAQRTAAIDVQLEIRAETLHSCLCARGFAPLLGHAHIECFVNLALNRYRRALPVAEGQAHHEIGIAWVTWRTEIHSLLELAFVKNRTVVDGRSIENGANGRWNVLGAYPRGGKLVG